MVLGAIILFLIVGVISIISSLAGPAQSILGTFAFLAPWIHSIFFVFNVLNEKTHYADIVHNIPVLADSFGIGIIFFFIFLICLAIMCYLATVGVNYD